MLYMFLLPLCSFPQYQRNIPYTKTRGFGMRTSYYHIFGISTMHFCLSNIPQIPKRSFWAGCLLKHVYDPGILLLPCFPPLSTDTTASLFLLFQGVFLRKTPFSYIWAQTLCDTCNSILYVLNYLHLCCLFS